MSSFILPNIEMSPRSGSPSIHLISSPSTVASNTYIPRFLVILPPYIPIIISFLIFLSFVLIPQAEPPAQAATQSLVIGDQEKSAFMAEVLPIANHALEQKDYWLSIHGNLGGEFNIAWYPKFLITAINDVCFKKSLDLEITFHCADNFNFNGILRWGKGAGFSCLRVDLK